MESLKNYFPDLSAGIMGKFEAIGPVYTEWNSKINVISRKDIDNLYAHHVLHSLAIARTFSFPAGARVLDVGTGGGFPGIPLAIMFPEVKFTLLDSIGKKLLVAEAAAKAAGLDNVSLVHKNAAEERGQYNYIVSRAVMNAADLLKMTKKTISGEHIDGQPNGMIVLKGGDLTLELTKLEILKRTDRRLRGGTLSTFKIADMFNEEYYAEKYVVQLLF